MSNDMLALCRKYNERRKVFGDGSAFFFPGQDGGVLPERRGGRLFSIRAFYKYAAKMEITAVIHYNEIKKVPLKNLTKPDITTYMSEDSVKAILAQPTVRVSRERTVESILYDYVIYKFQSKMFLIEICIRYRNEN